MVHKLPSHLRLVWPSWWSLSFPPSVGIVAQVKLWDWASGGSWIQHFHILSADIRKSLKAMTTPALKLGNHFSRFVSFFLDDSLFFSQSSLLAKLSGFVCPKGRWTFHFIHGDLNISLFLMHSTFILCIYMLVFVSFFSYLIFLTLFLFQFLSLYLYHLLSYLHSFLSPSTILYLDF